MGNQKYGKSEVHRDNQGKFPIESFESMALLNQNNYKYLWWVHLSMDY